MINDNQRKQNPCFPLGFALLFVVPAAAQSEGLEHTQNNGRRSPQAAPLYRTLPNATVTCFETSDETLNRRLAIAAQAGDVEAVRSLLDCDANPNALTPWRENFSLDSDTDRSFISIAATPLHAAAWNGHTAVVDVLIAHGAAVDILNEWGLSVLLTAAEAGHADVVAQLLSAGADINRVANCDECIDETALTIAADRGHVDVVRRLLAAGADTTHQDRNGNTALSSAMRNEHWQVVELLSERESSTMR